MLKVIAMISSINHTNFFKCKSFFLMLNCVVEFLFYSNSGKPGVIVPFSVALFCVAFNLANPLAQYNSDVQKNLNILQIYRLY